VIAEALREQGQAPPPDLLPEVAPPAQPYRAAFQVLSAARAYGMNGPLPLTYSDMRAYAEAHGLAASMADLEEFTTLMQAQDGAYLTFCAQQAEQRTRAAH
jgi:hypothetical protein